MGQWDSNRKHCYCEHAARVVNQRLKKEKTQDAQDRPCVKPGQNSGSVEIRQNTGHKAQNRDCPG